MVGPCFIPLSLSRSLALFVVFFSINAQHFLLHVCTRDDVECRIYLNNSFTVNYPNWIHHLMFIKRSSVLSIYFSSFFSASRCGYRKMCISHSHSFRAPYILHISNNCTYKRVPIFNFTNTWNGWRHGLENSEREKNTPTKRNETKRKRKKQCMGQGKSFTGNGKSKHCK